MSSREVSLRERVQRAVAEHVDASEGLLLQLESADEATKLSTFASGWFRGLAAALEEIAVEIDQMRRPEEGAPCTWCGCPLSAAKSVWAISATARHRVGSALLVACALARAGPGRWSRNPPGPGLLGG